MDNLLSFLGAVLSSTFISAILNIIMQNRNNRFEFENTNRMEWRSSLKGQVAELSKSNEYDEKAKQQIDLLKLNLNAYGKCKSGEYPDDIKLDIMKDQHIWKEIDRIERGEGDYNVSIQKIIAFISDLLKFKWDISKDEVKIDFSFVILSLLYWGSVLFLLYIGGFENFYFIIACFGIYFIAFLLMLLPGLGDRIISLRTGKWYKSINKLIFCMLSGMIIWGITTFVILIYMLPSHKSGILIIEYVVLFCFYLFAITNEIRTLSYKKMYKIYEEAVIIDADYPKAIIYCNNRKKRKVYKLFENLNVSIEFKNIKKSKAEFDKRFENLEDDKKSSKFSKRRYKYPLIEYMGQVYYGKEKIKELKEKFMDLN